LQKLCDDSSGLGRNVHSRRRDGGERCGIEDVALNGGDAAVLEGSVAGEELEKNNAERPPVKKRERKRRASGGGACQDLKGLQDLYCGIKPEAQASRTKGA
jgi:hypothetical protein